MSEDVCTVLDRMREFERTFVQRNVKAGLEDRFFQCLANPMLSPLRSDSHFSESKCSLDNGRQQSA
jgi:hypothetical protein